MSDGQLWGWIGGIVGSLIGLLGGLFGAYVSIRNTSGPRERQFVTQLVDIEFGIWISTKTRWAHLTKVIAMPAVPRRDEFMKFSNTVAGDYFAFRVSEVTYREGGRIEVWTELLNNIDNRMYSFEEESEFDEYYSTYIEEGWQCPRGVGHNLRLAAADASLEDGGQPRF